MKPDPDNEVTVRVRYLECTRCKGSLAVELCGTDPCNICDSMRTIEQFGFAVVGGVLTVPCPECRGIVTCPECKGFGQVLVAVGPSEQRKAS